MKKLALITTATLIALSQSAYAQIDVGTYSVRSTAPVVHTPAPATIYVPNGR